MTLLAILFFVVTGCQNELENENLFSNQEDSFVNSRNAISWFDCNKCILPSGAEVHLPWSAATTTSIPEEVRAERVAERSGISIEKALDKLNRKDRERADYYNYFTFGNWGVAGTYDLCIDSSILGIEGTADMIIEFATRKGLI